MAKFKTATYLVSQPIVADVVGSAAGAVAFKVGDYVKVTPATATVSAYVAKAKISTATHIVAQGDKTLGQPVANGSLGHVNVEGQDYTNSGNVIATVAAAPVTITTTGKHLALYKIVDAGDVVGDADGNDCVAE